MIARTKSSYSQTEVIARQIRVQCHEFGRSPLDIQKSWSTLHRIRELIEFIPMASDDFGVAVSRINNACRYLESAEFGAAKYEIRLLLGVLKHSLPLDDNSITNLDTEIEILTEPHSNVQEGSLVR